METNTQKRYQERLASNNAALLLIDHQVGLFTGVRDIPTAELKHNVVALAKAAKVLGVPVIVTATSPEMWGPVIPELTEALPGVSIIKAAFSGVSRSWYLVLSIICFVFCFGKTYLQSRSSGNTLLLG